MNLAVVPARAGSVGVPGKNLRRVVGLSLLAWAIQAAKEARLIDGIVVTTDSQDVALEAARYGVTTVWRPPALATAEAPLDAAILHCIDAMSHEGTVVLLQPTVPYRRQGLVDDCISAFVEADADSLLTASRLHFVWTAAGNPLVPTRANRQRQPPAEVLYHEDGAVFVFKAELLRATGCRVGGAVKIFENERAIDVDTEDDLFLAESQLLANSRYERK